MGFTIVSKIKLNIFKILFILIFGVCVAGMCPVSANAGVIVKDVIVDFIDEDESSEADLTSDVVVSDETTTEDTTSEPDDNTKLMIVLILGGGLIIIIATVLSVVLSTATTVASVVTEQDASDM